MRKRYGSLLIALLWLGLFFPVQPATAQSEEAEQAKVEVKVTVDGEPYAGAVIALKSTDSDKQCEDKTDADGDFSCYLPAGGYQLSLRIEGRLVGRREVTLEEGKVARLDIPLTKEMLEEQEKAQDAQARFEKAIALNKEGQHEQAAPILESLAAELPDQWAVHAQLAVAYDKLGRLEDAAAHYEKAVELQPDNYALHMNLGGVYAKQGRAQEAQEQYETVAELAPEQASTAYFNLGVTLYNSGELKAAIEPFRKATDLNPERATAFYLLGVCLYNSAQTKIEGGEVKTVLLPGTRESFERYLELEPNGPFANDAQAMLQALEATAPASVKVED